MQTLQYLPYSARRYSVTSSGLLLDINGISVPSKLVDGHLMVEIEWVNGKQNYLLATLILVAYDLVRLPEHLYSKITPMYIDGCCTNLNISNLIYSFGDKPIEVEDYPGFYYIPFNTIYGISYDGDLINTETGKVKTWSYTKPDLVRNAVGGYHFSRVVNNFGKSVTLFRHRAMLYTFSVYPNNVLSLVVNHKDGNPDNNKLENLEFCSYQYNNIHAVEIGLRGDNKPVLSKNLKTGEIIKFASILACGRHYGQTQAGFVQNRLRVSKGKVFSDFLLFKFDDGTDWPNIDIRKVKIHRQGRENIMVARNVFTGKTIVFEGTPQGAYATGVKQGTILSHVRTDANIPVNGWNFRYVDKLTFWPKHTPKHLLIYEKYPMYPPDGMTVVDTETGTEQFYESAALVAMKFKCIKSIIYHCAKTKKLFRKRYLLKVFEIRKNLGHPT